MVREMRIHTALEQLGIRVELISLLRPAKRT